MESSHLVIFPTSGKFITKFNVLRCIILSETLFWTGASGRIPITLRLRGIMIGRHFHANIRVQTAMCKDSNNSESRAPGGGHFHIASDMDVRQIRV